MLAPMLVILAQIITPTEVVAPKAPLQKHVTFVVDTSGSMIGHTRDAISSLDLIGGSDDYKVKAVRFGS